MKWRFWQQEAETLKVGNDQRPRTDISGLVRGGAVFLLGGLALALLWVLMAPIDEGVKHRRPTVLLWWIPSARSCSTSMVV